MIKILYVDDEKINLKLLELNFRGKFEVLTAEDGFSGIKKLDENPDVPVIISDMKMPGMDGLEFIRKAKEKHPDKKYYILTGFDITDEIQESLRTGLIVKYFRKPFNKNEIEAAINEVTSS